MRNHHYTVHQKEFINSSNYSELESGSLKDYKETNIPDLSISLNQRKHRARRERLHLGKSKKSSAHQSKEAQLEEIPSLSMSLLRNHHYTVRENPFTLKPALSLKTEESKGLQQNLSMSLTREHHETIHEHEFDTHQHLLHMKGMQKEMMPELGMGMYRENNHQEILEEGLNKEEE